MTKTHFIALADRIKRMALPDGYCMSEWYEGYACAHSAVIDELAAFCKEMNPAFNEERWRAYIAGTCGPNGGAIKKVGK